MIVADANLIIYRHVQGPLTKLADEAWANDDDWRSAVQWRCEMTSAVVKMIRGGVLEESAAIIAMADAGRDLAERESVIPQDQAMQVALRYGISAYDAQYIALAEILGVTCVTADAALARKTPGVSVLLAQFVKEHP